MTVTDTKRSTKYFAVTFPEKESKCTNRVHITQNGRKQTVTTENVSKPVWQEDACKTNDPYCVVIAVCGMDRI